MACYAGATVDITRVVTWHVLESVWDRQAGQSPIMQVLREINAREDQVGITKTAWYYVGADPVDTDLATDSVFGGVYAGGRLWVQAMDALLAVLALGGIVGDDGIRWTVTDVSTIRTALLATVGSSSGTRQTNARLLEKWKMIIEALRDALDAIEEKASAAWTASYIDIYLGVVPDTLERSGYASSWNSGCKVERVAVVDGFSGSEDLLFYDFIGGAGGNSFPGVSTPHDNFVETSRTNFTGGPGGDTISEGELSSSALCAGHNYFSWGDDTWDDHAPDDFGFAFGEDGVGTNTAEWEAFNDPPHQTDGLGWFCFNVFDVEFFYQIGFGSDVLAPDSEISVVVALVVVAADIDGVSNVCSGTWSNNLYSATHDESDAIGVHSIGGRTLTMTDAGLSNEDPEGTYFAPDVGNFSAAAARAVLTVNGDAASLITWTDGVLAGGNFGSGAGTRIRLATCVDALNRHHLDA
ncbi:MAG: hypothetical protein HYV27_15355 [Candidatus Hydrogenedentes bacterium]|nr:hypothetical protein [Candidatus Hydrogenedentota bacterium]